MKTTQENPENHRTSDVRSPSVLRQPNKLLESHIRRLCAQSVDLRKQADEIEREVAQLRKLIVEDAESERSETPATGAGGLAARRIVCGAWTSRAKVLNQLEP